MPRDSVLRLKQALDVRLATRGFTADADLEESVCYRADLGDGLTAKFVLEAIHCGSSVIPYMQIACGRIEEIMDHVQPRRAQAPGTDRTLFAEIGKVMYRQRKFWEFWVYSSGAIQPLGNLPQAVVRLERLFEKYAAPFYATYATLPAVEAALNDRPGEMSPYCGIWPLRIAHGLIAARLVRPDRYEALAAEYEDIAEQKLSAAQKRQFDFKKFVDGLEETLP